jgi:L-lactate dehydrogenase complex protein LldE
MPESQTRPRVGLFVTCLVDLFRPGVGFAALKLLEQAGCEVEVPAGQTCCGQPAYNSGDRADARRVARTVLDAFAEVDHVVAPSGSCAAMIRVHYPALFAGTPDEARARAIAAKTHELVSFLVDERGMTEVEAEFAGKVTYHDSCSGLRELEVREQPRRLLASIAGLELAEMQYPDVCCGFGGTFCVKYPDISNRMLDDKRDDVAATGADTLLAGDLGCLLNMAGKFTREGRPVQVRHVAEVLAGMTDAPPIGESES